MIDSNTKRSRILYASLILIPLTIIFIANVLIIVDKYNIYLTIICSIITLLMFIISNIYIMRGVYLTYLDDSTKSQKYYSIICLLVILIILILYTTFMLMSFIMYNILMNIFASVLNAFILLIIIMYIIGVIVDDGSPSVGWAE